MPTALITGATVGIGEAFARRLAADGYDLILVARNEQRLHEVADSLPVKCEVLPADLDDDAGVEMVEERLRRPDVDLLVNNAGIGTDGELHEIDMASEESMLRINVRAVMRLSAAALPAMIDRGAGSIVNVSSMAAFVPVVGAATYAASKAYVMSFSQSLSLTYRDRGIKVMAVCPGLTATEFHERAGTPPVTMPKFMWLTAAQVANTAVDDLNAGKTLSIAGAPYKASRILTKLLPELVVRRMAGGFKVKHDG